jgi:hypothetical protein
MDVESIIQKYSPIIYINSREKYFPCSIDWMLKYSTLVDFNTNTKIKSPSQKDLYNISNKYNFETKTSGDIVLSFGPEIYRGQSPVSETPIYSFYYFKGDYLYITYVLLFPYNGNYNILGLATLGEHPGDIESITIECSKTDGKLLRVYFGSHGFKDGQWVDASKVEYENNHVVCFMAYQGHGLYPKQGIVIRYGGLANDITDRGFKWSPSVVMIYYKDNPKFNIDTMGWSVYTSRIGGGQDHPNTDGTSSLGDKPWFKNGINPDPNYYKSPPLIITGNFVDFYNAFIIFLELLIIILSTLLVKFMTDKFIWSKFKGKNVILQFLGTLGIIFGLYYTILTIGNYVIINYIKPLI